MSSRDDHDRIVEQLYASAMGDVPWTATLKQLADSYRSKAAAIQITDPAHNFMAVENYGYSLEFATKFYGSEAYANDPRVPYYMRVKPGEIYYDNSLYDQEEMDRNPWCRLSCEILDSKYQMGSVSQLADGSFASFSFLRTEKEGHVSEAQIRDFRRLAPHIEQALSLGAVMEQRAATQAALLEALSLKADAIILLSSAGTPTFMNDAAQRILAAGDGLSFSKHGLVAQRGPETRRLHALLQAAIAASTDSNTRPGGHMLVTRRSGLRPYVLRVLPAPPVERFLARFGVGCMVHIHDLAAVRLPSKESLHAVFGLSERECDLAIELVRCASLADAAENAGMAVNTARNHLQSIFRKTGASNQADAVQLFGRLA